MLAMLSYTFVLKVLEAGSGTTYLGRPFRAIEAATLSNLAMFCLTNFWTRQA